jgi:hypothetical protein
MLRKSVHLDVLVSPVLVGALSTVVFWLMLPSATTATDWTTADIFNWPTTPSGASDPTNLGKWADPDTIPNPLEGPPATINPVHAVLLAQGPKGKLLIFRNQIAHMFDFNDSSETTFDARDGGPDQPDNRHEFFCSAHLPLPNPEGHLLIVGGNRKVETAPGSGKFLPHTEGWASLFDPEAASDPFYGDSTDTDLPPETGMDAFEIPARWYPTVTELPDGKTLLVGGTVWADGLVGEPDSLDQPGEYRTQRKWVVLDAYSSTPGVPWEWRGLAGSPTRSRRPRRSGVSSECQSIRTSRFCHPASSIPAGTRWPQGAIRISGPGTIRARPRS